MSSAYRAERVLRTPDYFSYRNGRRVRFGLYGFTLIELLVVISVIGILAAMLFPVFVKAQNSSKDAQCLSNLKQIGQAWQMYADAYEGRACISYYFGGDGWQYNWDFAIGPGQKSKLGLISNFAKNGEINRCPSYKKPRAYSSDGRPYTGYAYNATYIGGDAAANPPVAPCFLSSIKHPTKTVVFADAAYGAEGMPHNFLRAPGDSLYASGTVHFRHNGAASVCFADVHVEMIKTKYNVVAGAPLCGSLSADASLYDRN